MSTYDGPPTPGWAMQANRVQEAGSAATRYDERARKVREREQNARIREIARQLKELDAR